MTRHKSNEKTIWQLIKIIINKRKYTHTNLQMQTLEVKILWLKMGSWFQTISIFFINGSPTLTKKTDHSSKCPTHFISYNAVHTFYLKPVTENALLKIISNLTNSSVVWDDLKSKMIKKINDHIAISLTHMCNLSFNTSVFPCEPKVANFVMTMICCTICDLGFKNKNHLIWRLLCYRERPLKLWKVNM